MTLPSEIAAGGTRLVRWAPELESGLASAFSASEPELRAWMPSASTEQANPHQFIELCVAAFDAGTTYAYAIVIETTVVGYCNLTPHGDRAEIAYWVRSDVTGRGIGGAVIRALTESALDCLPELRTVYANIDAANVGSRRAAEKAGFRLRGQSRRAPRTWAESDTELTLEFSRRSPPSSTGGPD